jgi:coniferyl-aldehyde dehydrogenase
MSLNEVSVSGEELADPNVFTALPFNHIIFTGSPGIGKIVMRTASESLTPVTLDVGGKSPAVVMRDYPLADAAKRIVHGKTANCGQICVSPDYALEPRAGKRFRAELSRTPENADPISVVTIIQDCERPDRSRGDAVSAREGRHGYSLRGL